MIHFHTIKFKNFLSFGNSWTTMDLNAHQTTVIVGTNGAGKSTLLDAITYVLYGKSYRNINKPQLINSVNTKGLEVEIKFRIGAKEYRIRRGMKPAIFEIYENEKLIDQESRALDQQSFLEKNILHMNYIAFTQIVVLGKATYVPFMRLRPAERRNLIEELLSLTIFSKMNDVLKSRLSNAKNDKARLDNDLALIEERIELRRKYIEQLSVDNKARVREIKDQIKEITDFILKDQERVAEIQEEKSTILDKLEQRDKLKARQRELDKIDFEFGNKKKRFAKKINFLETNDTCPTCTQEIGQDYKQEKLHDYNSSLTDLDLDMARLDSALDKVNSKLETFQGYVTELRALEVEEGKLLGRIKTNEKNIVRLHAKKDEGTEGNVNEEETQLTKLKRDLDDARDTRADLNTTVGYYQSIGTMLKDTGIKSVIVQKYLPIFNQLINQYLTKLDFFVQFELDDTFSENIVSRNRDKFSYSSFSEGEKLRLDLAILLTWREIAKMKNSMAANLLIMDEIFDSSLDQSGVDAFIDLIPKMENANVFVISHTPAKLYDKFKSILEIEKDGNFSIIK